MLHLRAPQGAVCWGVTFSPDGTRLAANTRGGVTIWDALTGRVVGAFRGCAVGSGVCSAAFTPDGKRLGGASGGGTVEGRAVTTRRGGFTWPGRIRPGCRPANPPRRNPLAPRRGAD